MVGPRPNAVRVLERADPVDKVAGRLYESNLFFLRFNVNAGLNKRTVHGG